MEENTDKTENYILKIIQKYERKINILSPNEADNELEENDVSCYDNNNKKSQCIKKKIMIKAFSKITK